MKTQHPFRLLALLLCALSLAVSSCSGDGETPEPSKEELLSEKTWKVSKITLDGADVTYHPAMATVRSVRARYAASGVYTESSADYVHTGTWRLLGNTLLLYPGTQDEERWDILSLARGALRISSTIVYADGSSDLMELELVHAG